MRIINTCFKRISETINWVIFFILIGLFYITTWFCKHLETCYSSNRRPYFAPPCLNPANDNTTEINSTSSSGDSSAATSRSRSRSPRNRNDDVVENHLVDYGRLLEGLLSHYYNLPLVHAVRRNSLLCNHIFTNNKSLCEPPPSYHEALSMSQPTASHIVNINSESLENANVNNERSVSQEVVIDLQSSNDSMHSNVDNPPTYEEATTDKKQ